MKDLTAAKEIERLDGAEIRRELKSRARAQGVHIGRNHRAVDVEEIRRRAAGQGRRRTRMLTTADATASTTETTAPE